MLNVSLKRGAHPCERCGAWFFGR